VVSSAPGVLFIGFSSIYPGRTASARPPVFDVAEALRDDRRVGKSATRFIPIASAAGFDSSW
jgi:hypothetical protein